MSDETITTTVRMKRHTVEQLEQLKNITHAASNSDMIRKALDISDFIVHAIMNGERIIIENKKGRQQQLLVPGVNLWK